MQPKARQSSRAGAAKTRTKTCELVEEKQKLLDTREKRTREVREQALPSEYHQDLIRVVEELDGTVESTDTIVKLKTKIENSSTFESDPDFVKTLIQNCIDERVSQTKERSQNFKPKIKENYPQYHERENKNCYICGDSSHCARDCEKRFKPKESNDHIHNKIIVNTLKIESEKQNSDECANLQYVNINVENQPVTALIDSGCQIPVLNSSLIRLQTPSEEIITLSSCFGEQRMVEVKPINISLNQHSPSLSVRTAISPTLTEEFIIHPSVYSEIKKLGHAKSDVLLNESESSLGAHAYAYSSAISFPNVSVSNVIENSSYDLPYVKNFNTRNDSSSLIKDYKCNKIKSTKLKLSIVREKCSDIVLCKKANGAMKTSSVEFISRSPNPLPMKSEHRRPCLFRFFLYVSDSPLVSMEIPLRTAYSQNGRCGMQPKARQSSRAGAAKTRTKTCELVEEKQKLLDTREKRTREVREQALPSEYHRQTYL
ncbi:hypothetical protein TNCV_822411 [Trichonephila clavipes]|nr:hypothetical protein TNCV_822411 [Trichonephila clavipes]